MPIHSQLIKLGLLDYVEGLRVKGETLLFHPGDWITKWFHRLMKNLGVKGKKSLQGLRPTVTMKLYEAGVDGETRRALLGHSGNVDETDYLRLSLKTLSELGEAEVPDWTDPWTLIRLGFKTSEKKPNPNCCVGSLSASQAPRTISRRTWNW